MFQDIEDQIDNFSDLTGVEQEALFSTIRKRAAADKVAFKTYVSGLEYGLYSPRQVIYEALYEKPQGWGDFLFEELQRFILEAKNGHQGAIDDLTSIYYLSNPEGMPPEFYARVVNFLSKHLNASHPRIRARCMEEIMDAKEDYEVELSAEQIKKVQQLLTDDDFKVRINTYSYLNDGELLPKGFQVPFLDKWRAKLTGKGYLLK